MSKTVGEPIPVIDLFSGPGGLAEGFASARDGRERRMFRIALSAEVDVAANRTLRLRALLRKFHSFPDEYYRYIGESKCSEPDWGQIFPKQWEEVLGETPRIEIGSEYATKLLRTKIQSIRSTFGDRTVLIGGPPCQSYSVAGRSRNAGNPNYDMNSDHRISLYTDFVSVLKLLRPMVAILENVKGILSVRVNGKALFGDVMNALQDASKTNQYELFSLAPNDERKSWRNGLHPTDFVVRAEKHGVPQRRHRVFVVCIRSDISSRLPSQFFPKLEPHEDLVTLNDVIGVMPSLRSKLSKADDGKAWQLVINQAIELVKRNPPNGISVRDRHAFERSLTIVKQCVNGFPLPTDIGKTQSSTSFIPSCPSDLRDWMQDENLPTLPNNETRGHMATDLHRFLFATIFAKVCARPPRAKDFPSSLAPNHANWLSGNFSDRFRVQLPHEPSTTITSHIAKDGNYFIHPDPRQCRSLTVREAARLQTFPDNYLFLGGRTQQYSQVGNAVPPYLAWQIANQIAKIFQFKDSTKRRGRSRSRIASGSSDNV